MRYTICRQNLTSTEKFHVETWEDIFWLMFLVVACVQKFWSGPNLHCVFKLPRTQCRRNVCFESMVLTLHLTQAIWQSVFHRVQLHYIVFDVEYKYIQPNSNPIFPYSTVLTQADGVFSYCTRRWRVSLHLQDLKSPLTCPLQKRSDK